MHDQTDPANSVHEEKKPMRQLCTLMNAQVEKYQEAKKLEIELAELIGKEDFTKISENTQRKTTLLNQINKTNEELMALARPHQAVDGSFSNTELEALRLQAVALLEQLQELEANNRAALEGFRDTMLKNFRQTKQAKRVAHGYKQSKSIYRSKHDTRR